MNFLIFSLSALLALHAMGCSAAQPPRAPRAIALKPAPPAVMAKVPIASLCAKLATPCNAETTQAWLGAPSSWASALFIDTSRPMLIALQSDGGTLAWDFADYRHTRSPPGQANRHALDIYPALYPVPGNGYAIAVVHGVTEGYSGGGAGFGLADFVALHLTARAAAADKPYTLLYAGVPFSCSKILRACFSEREYQTSRHCHDDWSGHLTIQFSETRDSTAKWSFTWHETHWPAHVTKAHIRRTQTRFTLPTGPAGTNEARPKGVSFCDGGPP